jgi:hypothetical protein
MPYDNCHACAAAANARQSPYLCAETRKHLVLPRLIHRQDDHTAQIALTDTAHCALRRVLGHRVLGAPSASSCADGYGLHIDWCRV